MRDVWIASDSIVSPLGFNTNENYSKIKAGISGITSLRNSSFSKDSVYAGWIQEDPPKLKSTNTRFETLCLLAIEDACKDLKNNLPLSRTALILSTTKGNIELIEQGKSDHERIALHASAQFIAECLEITQKPIVVSNACISGVMALIVAKRLLQSDQCDHVIVVGADVLTRFVISGFQSLQAISQEPCRPFDLKRSGVNLGEAAAAIILTAGPEVLGIEKKIKILEGGLSNDANHISGPSRTGEELAQAVLTALKRSDVLATEIDFISAHGTATLYNDEMEAKAFNHAGLKDTPLNSLKGYFGHTLGAAGIIETIINVRALIENELIPTYGFEELGVSKPLNIIQKVVHKKMTTFLKTASGFGGCNAALVFRKF